MPLTRVIDQRKERENINKFYDLKVHCRKWASPEIEHLAAHSVLLCLALHPHPVKEIAGTRPHGRKMAPSHLWPEVQMEKKLIRDKNTEGYPVTGKICDPNHVNMTESCHIISERWLPSTPMNGNKFSASFGP